MSALPEFADVKAATLRSLDYIIQRLLPGGKRQGDEWVVRNPTRADNKAKSFSINMRTGVWADFATGETGADMIDLYQLINGGTNVDAKNALAEMLNVQASGERPAAKVEVAPKVVITAAPAEARTPPITFPPRTQPDKDGKPFFEVAGDEGPKPRADETRRHIYTQGGVPVRIKIIKTSGNARATNAYRVTDANGVTGWQYKKPEGFLQVPYTVASADAFTAAFLGRIIFWVEGEKDVDTIASLGGLAFTFGGTGDGTPEGCQQYIVGRDVVILADNDEPGREHAEEKAALCAQPTAISVKVVHFPELADKSDVSDWIASGKTFDDLKERVLATEDWKPPAAPLGTTRDANSPTPSKALPIMEVKDGELSSLATKAKALLIDAGVPVYQRGGTLVRPIIETVDASRGRKTKVAQLRVLDPVYMRDLMGRHAKWEKYDARSKKNVPTNPPTETAATVMARAGDWTFKTIMGVISAPTMRPDGSLLMDQGYDEATGLLLVEPPPMPVIPDQPTREDALEALKLLEGLLPGFPFVEDVSRSVALSALISPVVRGAFTVLPMHASRAPTPGTGKSFLWDIVAAIAVGQVMPVMSTGADTEELEKRLGAAMLAGQPLISIDNISGELAGDLLCQVIERPVVEIRILGRSEKVKIEARGTSTFATGNNFVVVGDLCRRVITANLDAAMERPELRQFKFDPVELVLADRGKYIAAALTICRAYRVASQPDKAPRLASFEGWSDTVRSALIWLGQADPVLSMEAARSEDPERLEISDMMEAWGQVIGVGGPTRVRLADMILKGMAMSRPAEGEPLEPDHPELFAALEAIALKATGKRGQKPDAAMLGMWLRRYKGRVIDGKRFANLANDKRGAEWWVEGV
jgi:hypothetical protein